MSLSVAEPEREWVLVADDDAVTRRILRHHLETAGYRVLEAADGREAMRQLSEDVAVALFDLQMPGASGLECLKHSRERFPDTQVLVISGQGEIRDAVAAMKQGAAEYVTKPFSPEEVLIHVEQAARTARLTRDNRGLREAVSSPLPPVSFIAQSHAAQSILSQVEKIARLDSTLLITGASGTGKTTLARMIHQSSARVASAQADCPFINVSCAALPRDLIESELFGHERGAFTGAVSARPGRAEMAHGGTLFLDEIGDLPLELQPKLLTFLQDHTLQRLGGNRVYRVDVRVIAATHQDLSAMCRQKQFREDLFFRLNVLAIHMPSLTERRQDLPGLIDQFLRRIARQRRCPPLKVAEDAQAALLAYHWPGNIRELENMLERASAFCENGTIRPADLAFHQIAASSPGLAAAAGGSLAGLSLDEVERRAITDTLQACDGNRATAARQLGISERSVYNKIKRWGLE